MKQTQYRFGKIRSIPDDVDKTRTVEFIISDESRDRHNTVLSIEGWNLKAYKKNPLVGYQHNVMSPFWGEDNPDNIIGTSEVFIEGKQLIGRVTFEPPEINPLAEKIFQKVKFGTLRTASVGFQPLKPGKYGDGDEAEKGKNETYYFGERELIEWSIVHVPSNKNAVKREIIQMISDKYKELLSEDDIKKLTADGLLNLMIEKGLEKDNTEREESDQLEREQNLAKTRLDIYYKKMRLNLHKHEEE